MPTPRSMLGVAVLNGILYAVGGGACVTSDVPCATNSVATVEAYDPVTDTWTTKASMPTARQSLGTAVANGRLYAIGGHQTTDPFNSGTTNFLSTNEEYDPATDSWTSKAPMPTPRYGPGVAALNGVLHAIGGDGQGPRSVGTHEEFDPVANAWTVRQAMPTARFWAGVAVVNGKVFVVGGNGAFAIVEAYQP
jgi:N-acetylneuraminic acid mutarotase